MPDQKEGPQAVLLTGFTLSDAAGVLRDHIRKAARRTPHYLEAYDRRTLLYDCVYQPRQNAYLFTAPMFGNLWPVFRDGLRLNGQPVKGLKRTRRGKYDQVVLRAPRGPLGLVVNGIEYDLQQRQSISPEFGGLNCAVTMNRNNHIDWVFDWATYHVAAHRLEAVLIFDNGSTDYTPQDLATALGAVDGLQTIAVASAPYPYGTTDKVERGEIRPNFLQPAMLNLARSDFLADARAVLNVDIDELVQSRDGSSVFDTAVARRNMAVRLPVYWAYPEPSSTGPVRQSAHLFRDTPKQRTPRKWCAVPKGALSRLGWHVHHIGGELFKLNPESKAHEVIHCRATSTGWNPRRHRLVEHGDLVKDPELARLMALIPRHGDAEATDT